MSDSYQTHQIQLAIEYILESFYEDDYGETELVRTYLTDEFVYRSFDNYGKKGDNMKNVGKAKEILKTVGLM